VEHAPPALEHYPPSYGPAAASKSTDGGTTWRQLTTGLPTDDLCRIGIAVSPRWPTRVYAIVDAKDGGLYRSTMRARRGAESRATTGSGTRLGYFCKVSSIRKSAGAVYVSNTSLYKSTEDVQAELDGHQGCAGRRPTNHQLWINPDDPKRMIVGSDQGAVVTEDGALSWSSGTTSLPRSSTTWQRTIASRTG